MISWSSRPEMVFKKVVLKNFRLRPATLLKKRPWHRCFPVNFAKFQRTPFYITPLVAASVMPSLSMPLFMSLLYIFFGMFELEGPNLFCSRFLIYLKNICQLTCLFSVEVNLHKSKILLKCVSQTIEIDREFRLYFRNKYI